MDVSFHLKIREAYLEIAKKNKKKYKIINANESKELIARNIYKIISDLFSIK